MLLPSKLAEITGFRKVGALKSWRQRELLKPLAAKIVHVFEK